MTLLTTVPEPVLDGDDAPLPTGEVVALPVPAGEPITLRFPSPFEPYITVGGKRLVGDTDPAARELILWSSRRLPALWRALDERVGLRAVLRTSGAPHDAPSIVVMDLVSLEEPGPEGPAFLDHGMLRERLETANVELARFSLLGPLSTKAELERRVRATYAPGSLVEIRVEDGRRVVARRRLRVGR